MPGVGEHVLEERVMEGHGCLHGTTDQVRTGGDDLGHGVPGDLEEIHKTDLGCCMERLAPGRFIGFALDERILSSSVRCGGCGTRVSTESR